MNFSLRAVGEKAGIPISQQQFLELKLAKQVVVHSIRIEDKFDVMMENHIELERCLFDIAVNHMAFDRVVSNELHLKRSLVSRRLVNLFSATQLYRNTLRGKADKIFGQGSGASERIRLATSDGPNQPKEFRMMQVIRNYSQHNELPLSSLRVGARLTRDEKKLEIERIAYSVTPKINGPDIASHDRKLPLDIRTELIQLGKKADVMPLVRKSLERWGEIHQLFRDEIKPLTTSAEASIRAAISKVQAEQTDVVSLVYLTRDQSGASESIQLFDEMFPQLDYFLRKNRARGKFSLSYVEWS